MDKHPDDLLTGDGDPFKGDPNFMASPARGLEVIQAFTPQRPLLSISQISQKTGIPRAAVRRCLYTLSKLGFVYAEDGKNFQLRPRIGAGPRTAGLDAAGAFGAAGAAASERNAQ